MYLLLSLDIYTAKSFGLSKRDRKTISMETGIQNGGLGLLLIFGFFEGLGGMALVGSFLGNLGCVFWNGTGYLLGKEKVIVSC